MDQINFNINRWLILQIPPVDPIDPPLGYLSEEHQRRVDEMWKQISKEGGVKNERRPKSR